jgi:hypothetical protein
MQSVRIDHAIFTVNESETCMFTFKSIHRHTLTHKVTIPSFGSTQQAANLRGIYAKIWTQLRPATVVHETMTVDHSLRLARELGEGGSAKHVLLTGSLRLVGIALSILNQSKCEAL